MSRYEPSDSSLFYINNDFTETTFELSFPNGWDFEEDATASLIKFYDKTSSETVTLQVFTDDDPTGLIESHLNVETKDGAKIDDVEMTRLVGTGMDPAANEVTHVIRETDHGWFVFSGYEYNDNMFLIIESLKFY